MKPTIEYKIVINSLKHFNEFNFVGPFDSIFETQETYLANDINRIGIAVCNEIMDLEEMRCGDLVFDLVIIAEPWMGKIVNIIENPEYFV